MALKARALVKIPARLVGSGTVEVTLEGGIYTISAVGVNDGDKGDVTVSSSGTVWTVDNNAITFAKMQDISANRLLGAVTAGDPVEISIGTGLSFAGTTLNASAGSPGGAGTELQYRNGASFGGAAGTAWDDTNRSLTITGATVTTSKPVLDLSQTWNAGGAVFTGIKLDITNTASAAGSNLIDIKKGGTSLFEVDTDGTVFITHGGGGGTADLFCGSGILSTNNSFGSNVNISWGGGWGTLSGGNSGLTITQTAGGSGGIVLNPGNDDFIEVRNGTAAQTVRVSNTWTDVNNWERLGITWAANVCTIETEALGTGTARVVQFKGRHVAPMRGELTIASGAITVTSTYHNVDTEADAASDDLDTINGGVDGAILILRANHTDRTVVVKDGTGNLQLTGDHSLDNTQDTITLIFDSTLSAWLEIARASSGA